MPLRRFLQHAIAPVLTLAAVGLSAVVAGYATKGTEVGGAGTFLEPEAAPPAFELRRGLVTRLQGDRLSVSVGGDEQQFNLSQGTVIEALHQTTLAEVAVGDWLNASAISHPQTLLVLRRLVFIDQAQVAPR